MRFRADPLPRIDGYDRLEEIGRGGFSRVYTAHQMGFERRVALKVITRAVDDDGIAAFRREQRITGTLDGHPNIIRVYDAGVTRSGEPFLAMEYLANGTVADRLRRHGPLPVADALRIGVVLACAIDAAHEQGIVHRDVKPQNVLWSPYVGPVLADFGIAGVLGDHRSDPEAFSVLHAAPEVLAGGPSTSAADIYSVTSTIYELLAGRAPFHDPHQPGLPAFLARARAGVVPPIDRPDLPTDADDALVRLLQASPEGRPASGLDLASRLRGIEAMLDLTPTALVGSTGSMSVVPPPTARRADVVEGQPAPSARPAPPAPSAPGPETLPPPGDLAAMVGPGPRTVSRAEVSAAAEAPPAEPPAPSTTPRRRRVLAAAGACVAVMGLIAVIATRDGSDAPILTAPATSVVADTDEPPTATLVLPDCPEPVTTTRRPPSAARSVANDVAVAFSGDGAVVTFTGDGDPSTTYVVFTECRDESGDLAVVPVSVVDGTTTRIVVPAADRDVSWCFAVGVLEPGGGTRLGTDSPQFHCAAA